ncbi:MAG: enoyl-CoA hydratase/isomerase family protein [Myxococcales bacterium]|nr:enoyl-CoA hydratase/isomerase family protein [Myxococcales bacterium]
MSDVLCELHDGIARLTLNRPTARNSLTPGVTREIAEHLERLSGDRDVRVVILTGAGKGFCSGADLRGDGVVPGEVGDYGELIRTSYHRLLLATWTCEKPVIARINGPAVGFGFDLTLACDIRLAVRDAKLGQVFLDRGLVPDGGSSFTLPRLVGPTRAYELMLTARVFLAEEAADWGLLTRVAVDLAELDALTDALARTLAAGPPIAQRLAKRNFRQARSLEEALALERDAQSVCLKSADFMEGIAAFFGKRQPNFRGE